MKPLRFAAPCAAALAVAAYAVYAADTTPPAGPRHMGPPPEALAACTGKSAGDAVSVTLPDGRTLAGTCELMFRPSRPPQQ